ncbi:GIN domain-containing protein [Spirosoma arcticum]
MNTAKNCNGLGIVLLLLITLAESYGQATEIRPLQPFEGIKTDGLVQAYLQQGEKENVRLAVKGIALQDVVTQVENGLLTVKTQGNHNGEDIKVYVTYRQLKSIAVGGASKVVGKSVIKGKTLDIATHGAGDAFLSVDVDALRISMEGAGNLTIAGQAKSEKIITRGRVRGSLDKTGLTTSK